MGAKSNSHRRASRPSPPGAACSRGARTGVVPLLRLSALERQAPAWYSLSHVHSPEGRDMPRSPSAPPVYWPQASTRSVQRKPATVMPAIRWPGAVAPPLQGKLAPLTLFAWHLTKCGLRSWLVVETASRYPSHCRDLVAQPIARAFMPVRDCRQGSAADTRSRPRLPRCPTFSLGGSGVPRTREARCPCGTANLHPWI